MGELLSSIIRSIKHETTCEEAVAALKGTFPICSPSDDGKQVRLDRH